MDNRTCTSSFNYFSTDYKLSISWLTFKWRKFENTRTEDKNKKKETAGATEAASIDLKVHKLILQLNGI